MKILQMSYTKFITKKVLNRNIIYFPIKKEKEKKHTYISWVIQGVGVGMDWIFNDPIHIHFISK